MSYQNGNGRFRILVKKVDEARATEVERCHSLIAAKAVALAYFGVYRNEGFKCATKFRENRKMWLRRGKGDEQELVTIELQFTATQSDIDERVRGTST
jgi:hypothetical protein